MSAVTSLVRKTFYNTLGIRRTAERHSYFKAAFIAGFVALFEIGIFFLFIECFGFLGTLGGAGLMIIYRLFSLSFFGLSLMLATSSIVTSYATMYRSAEVPFLVVRPYSLSQITMYKFLESAFLSSWAFFFIIVPFVSAYAWHEDLSAFFAIWTFLFSVPFVILFSAIGALITMVIVRWAPRGRWLRILIPVLIGGAMIFIVYASRSVRMAGPPTGIMLNRIIPGLKIASHPLLPSWWVSEGILALAHGQWMRGIMLWLLLVANCLIMCLLVEAVGRGIFYEGWQRVVATMSKSLRRKPLLGWLEKGIVFIKHDVRAVIIKDLRMLLRDPLQWSQFLIFFGLLGLYFGSLRSFRYHELDPTWRTLIAFLNIFSMSTVLCSLASRFIYPQLSLEGQGFWILGLGPTTMGRILMTKFVMSLIGMGTISIGLMYLSVTMLQVDPAIKAVALALAVAISLAVAGMSTGLGAIFLDLKQKNPAAIVSGFGGTLNLVLSLAFMLSTLLPFAAAFHLSLLGRITASTATVWMGRSYAWLILVTAIAASTPLILGRRSLMSREY